MKITKKIESRNLRDLSAGDIFTLKSDWKRGIPKPYMLIDALASTGLEQLQTDHFFVVSLEDAIGEVLDGTKEVLPVEAELII